jgi:hypothetical protein
MSSAKLYPVRLPHMVIGRGTTQHFLLIFGTLLSFTQCYDGAVQLSLGKYFLVLGDAEARSSLPLLF